MHSYAAAADKWNALNRTLLGDSTTALRRILQLDVRDVSERSIKQLTRYMSMNEFDSKVARVSVGPFTDISFPAKH